MYDEIKKIKTKAFSVKGNYVIDSINNSINNQLKTSIIFVPFMYYDNLIKFSLYSNAFKLALILYSRYNIIQTFTYLPA